MKYSLLCCVHMLFGAMGMAYIDGSNWNDTSNDYILYIILVLWVIAVILIELLWKE